MEIYAVEVMTLGGLYPTRKISQEGYKTIEQAKLFCESRCDKPEIVDDYEYRSKDHIYRIIPINVI